MMRGARPGPGWLSRGQFGQARHVIKRVVGTGLAFAAIVMIYLLVLTRGAIL